MDERTGIAEYVIGHGWHQVLPGIHLGIYGEQKRFLDKLRAAVI